MRSLRAYLFLLTISATTCVVAQEYDGSVPLSCKVLSGYDCLPGQVSCGKIKSETNVEPIYTINVATKQVKSPFRTALLKISNSTTNRHSLVLQGTDTAVAWSAQIRKVSGEMVIALTDSKGAYVAFGQCKLADKPAVQ